MTANDDDYVLLPATAASANSHNRFMVLAVALSVFLVQYSQSQAMIAPFLPASRPGLLMGPDLVGVAFSAYPLATAIVTPLPPKLLRHMGLRAMVMLGLCISSAANFAACIAGSLASESWAGVLDFCLILSRALGGAGAALSESGCLTAVSTAGWGEDMGKALSAVEITTGVGAALGAALGGWLYALGSWTLPMAVAGLLPLSVLPLVARALPAEMPSTGCDADSTAGGLGDIEWTVARMVSCASLVLSAMIFEGLNPLLEPHLHRAPYHLDIAAVGDVLAAICFMYTVTALPIGWLVDQLNHGDHAACRLHAIMLAGWVVALVAAILLAPGGGGGHSGDGGGGGGGSDGGSSSSSSVGEHMGGSGDGADDSVGYSLWPTSAPIAQRALLFAVPAMGASAAVITLPSLPDMQRGIPESDGSRKAAVCAVWNGMYAGGSAIGPLLSVVVYARVGWAAIILTQVGIAVAAAVAFLALACFESRATAALHGEPRHS